MAKRVKKTISDQERVRELRGFLGLAFRDYLAARVLLNADLLLQGAVLASTCIEKYFKAILAFHGGSRRGHLSTALARAVSNCDRGLMSSLSPAFLSFLQKCYRLRYLDDIEPSFSLTISAREVLAELDCIVAHIESKITLSRQDGQALLRRYHEMALQRDARLLSNNLALTGPDKGEFLGKPDIVYEMRLDERRGLMEAEYRIRKSPTDGDFLRQGYVPLGKTAAGGESYKLALAAGNLLVEEGGDSPMVSVTGGDK